MQILDHCDYAFPHLDPVLHSCLYNPDTLTFVSNTKSAIYLWQREGTDLYPASEAQHKRKIIKAPNDTEFTDMVVIYPSVVLADSKGCLNVYQPEDSELTLKFEIVSKKNSRIIDMDFKRDLFVLHEGGFVSRFIDFGLMQNGV